MRGPPGEPGPAAGSGVPALPTRGGGMGLDWMTGFTGLGVESGYVQIRGIKCRLVRLTADSCRFPVYWGAGCLIAGHLARSR